MKLSHLKKIHQEHIKIFILIGIIFLALIISLFNRFLDQIHLSQPTKMGISYSPDYAQALGLDPQETFQKILSEFRVKLVRLNADWDKIEPDPGKFEFQEVDYYIDQALKHNAQIILTIGYKLPRWPECRAPKWLDQENIKLRQERQFLMLERVIRQYEDNPAVIAWQVENEPLLPFGICPLPDAEFLEEEVIFVRSHTQKPIIITDSGELRDWIIPMRLSDYFGTTLYRTVGTPLLGSVSYPLKPWFYRLKSGLIRALFAPQNQKTIITELQAEPWLDKFITQTPLEEQIKIFPKEQLGKNIKFAQKVGFEEVYIWGVEWWYYMSSQGYPEYLQEAKEVFKN